MGIDHRRRWRCIAWRGPHGESGHGLWRTYKEFAQDEAWCAQMNASYPGWEHFIQENRGTPLDLAPEGWELHPFYGNMKSGPMGL